MRGVSWRGGVFSTSLRLPTTWLCAGDSGRQWWASPLPVMPTLVKQPLPPFPSLDDLLRDADLLHLGSLDSIRVEPFSVIASRAVEDRLAFLTYLDKEAGIDDINDRQKLANALIRAVRENRVPRWAGDVPKPAAPKMREPCAHCGRGVEKLLTCGRCKQAKYCGAACQRQAWPSHKSKCQKPPPPPSVPPGFATIPDHVALEHVLADRGKSGVHPAMEPAVDFWKGDDLGIKGQK